MGGNECRVLLSSRSRSQLGLIHSNYDCFHYIFGANDSFAMERSVMADHHKPKHWMAKVTANVHFFNCFSV